ncbi:MAG: leucine-rich repeat domain-containing protein [Nitrospirae bacterium]|nr:leucine-rich repeat domain-containing protein [Nitrospirota bacterium]
MQLNTRSISLAGTEISDEDLARLKVLKNLRVLDLRDTKISDAGLIYLYDLKALRFLYLSNTIVSDVGIGKLKKVLPRCKIER